MATEADIYAGGVNVTASAALENSHIFRIVPALYYGCDGRNTDASNAAFIWVVDNTVIAANGNITDGSVKHVISVAAGQNFAHGPSQFAELFKTGIVIIGSSTDFPTLTILTSNKLFISCDSLQEYGGY